jgi:cytochrome c biogenesis protein CcmG, thiol:disulfide interchange protein DsbE
MQKRQNSTAIQFRHSVLWSVAIVALMLATGCNRGRLPRELGKTAPAFTIHDGSQTASLGQYRGKVVVVTFWASYCAPCMEEFPSLLALHQRLPQLNILGISIDDDARAYRNFLASYHVDFPTVRDPSQEVMHSYGTVQIPEAYVINRSGQIVRKYVSAQDWNDPEIYRTLAATLNAKQ